VLFGLKGTQLVKGKLLAFTVETGIKAINITRMTVIRIILDILASPSIWIGRLK
jgi:hypothetical protein